PNHLTVTSAPSTQNNGHGSQFAPQQTHPWGPAQCTANCHRGADRCKGDTPLLHLRCGTSGSTPRHPLLATKLVLNAVHRCDRAPTAVKPCVARFFDQRPATPETLQSIGELKD